MTSNIDKATLDAAAAAISELVDRVSELFAGQPPEVTGAALADLVAIFLAGHIIRGSPDETDALREELLDGHIAAVRDLIPVNARAIGTDR